ncbi:MAG: trypsin-like peptidase domain-containing protein [Alphaproteobacteria bacterium]|nr:trypsin-like peptidase domain-containing protein [Alphaproteobacteria bacterium]
MTRLCAKMLWLAALPLLLFGCAEMNVKEVDYAQGRPVPESAHPKPIRFSRLRFLLPPGTEVGLESGLGLGLGRLCSWQNYPVNRRVFNSKLESEWIQNTFATALEANGYDVVENIDADFRPEDEIERAEYLVSARVKDVDLDVCHRGPDAFLSWFTGNPGTKGKLYAQIDWSVYDALHRTVVYKTSTEGYTERGYPNLEGLELLFYDAFEMAAHNLAADKDFYELIVEGKPPQQEQREHRNKQNFESTPHKFDAREAVDLQGKSLSRQPLPKHIEDVRKANVMIQKMGHGSGVFLTKEGHILTNQHVVGDATRMRIITKGKQHKLVAEVLRVDKVRDVALLKLEEVPENLEIETLPIRTEKLTISEDVYAMGNPIDYRALQDSVTKGIVSAHRVYKEEAVHLPFIQADVDIHGGNSGGALLDEYGNLVGISVSGVSYLGSGYSSGLNFFIPIAEALRALDITIDGYDAPDYPLSREEREEDDPEESYEAPIALVE